jgi:membrane protein
MKTHAVSFWKILKKAFNSWWAKDPFRESAIIAYYAIFSLPGLLVVVVTLAGYFFGKEAVNDQLSAQISGTLGETTAEAVQSMIATASKKGNSLLTSIIGIATILLGATGVFSQLQNSLNTIWQVKASTTKSGLWKVVKTRLFSYGIIVSISFILIVSLVISALLSAFAAWLSTHFSTSFHVLLQIINALLSLGVVGVLFALMFKFLPDAKVQWKHVWIGAFVTALLFEMGKFGLGFYFGKANPGTTYGAAASVILILLWTSYSTMIVFYGAEFTHAYANRISGVVAPKAIAKTTVHKKRKTKVPQEN